MRGEESDGQFVLVVLQEIRRMNRLMKFMNKTMSELKKGELFEEASETVVLTVESWGADCAPRNPVRSGPQFAQTALFAVVVSFDFFPRCRSLLVRALPSTLSLPTFF